MIFLSMYIKWREKAVKEVEAVGLEEKLKLIFFLYGT